MMLLLIKIKKFNLKNAKMLQKKCVLGTSITWKDLLPHFPKKKLCKFIKILTLVRILYFIVIVKVRNCYILPFLEKNLRAPMLWSKGNNK